MTKKTIKRLRNNINRHNRRVRHENTVFEKMTKAEQRVRLARDVIEHVAAKKITPHAGTWLSQNDSREDLLRGQLIDDNTQLKELLPKVEECHACAVGSLLYCTVMRVNALTVGQIRTAEKKPGVEIRDFDKIKAYLGEYFSVNQLDMMEAAFEQRNEPEDQTKSVTAAARMFMKRYRSDYYGWGWDSMAIDDETRLVVIMENVAANKGIFKPKRHV